MTHHLHTARCAAIAVLSLLPACGAPLPGAYDKLDYQTESRISTVDGNASTTAFYATNRLKADTAGPNLYLPKRGPALALGSCAVSVPRIHNIGSDVLTEQLARANLRPQPGRFEVKTTTEIAPALLPTDPPDEAAPNAFFSALTAALNATPRKDLLLLVHGYNNSFPGPVARAAELAYDLGAPIVPVAYCWVSHGTPHGYLFDENNVDGADRHLANFLEQLIARTPADTRIHLVAHSMGSRVTSAALRSLRARTLPRPKPITHLVFAAADIDAAELAARLADDRVTDLVSQRTTLYASASDRALQASYLVHGRTYPRAGQAGPDLLRSDKFDTVDVSLNDASIVGHSYYGDNRAVINDLHLLLTFDAPPERRNLYHVQSPTHPRYWLIRP